MEMILIVLLLLSGFSNVLFFGHILDLTLQVIKLEEEKKEKTS